MKNLFIVLGSSPRESRTVAAFDMAKACVGQGVQVKIFLIGNGIYNALQTQSIKNNLIKLRQLMEQGVVVSTCVNMAKFAGVDSTNVQSGVQIDNLLTFAEQFAEADRVLFFGEGA